MKVLASVLLLACTQASFGQLSGPLSGTLGPGVYDIVGDIWVNASDTLRLMPGTIFLFGEGLLFDIYGTLLAEGTESDSVIFTAVEDTTYWPSPWRGVTFYGPSSSGSWLAYCSLTYAGNWSGGGVRCFASSPIFSHCIISQNWTYSNGGGVYCDSSSSPTFNDCDIRENSAAGEWSCGSGGGVYCSQSSPTFINYSICDNGATWSSGGAECLESSVTFTNCLISGNASEAAQGGVLSFYDCSVSIINCTISDNGSYRADETIAYGGPSLAITNSIVAFSTGLGMVLWTGPEIEISHCDFFGNGTGAFGGEVPAGLGMLVTTNANGDSCDVYQNIFSDPMFLNARAGDYHLMDTSRCIGAGDSVGAPATDMDGNPRPNPPGTNPDIGAYENERGVPLYADFSLPYLPGACALHPNWPNPFNSTTMIRYDLTQAGQVRLTICNLLGQKIQTLTSGKHSASSYVVAWDAREWPSGIYFCRMEAGGFAEVRKLVLVR